MFLQKKVKRNNFPNEVSIKEDNIIIDINNSNLSLKPLNNSNNFFKGINIKKSSIVEKMENSEKNYGKCAFNNSDINYKIEKINLDIPIIPKICSKPILFANLIYFNNICFFFVGHNFNLLVYEIKGNDSFFLSSIFEINQNDSLIEDKIDNIYLLNENNLSNQIYYAIIGKIMNVYEFNFQEKVFINRKNIILNDISGTIYQYKLIKYSSKLITYDDRNVKIYDMIDSKYMDLEISLGELDDNIKKVQNFPNNLIIIITDKYLIIFDTITETIIHKISKKLQFGWEKILILKNNQFLLYNNSNAILYDYDFTKKFGLPQESKNLGFNNIKNINKILQVKNGDLIIFYECFNFAVFDMKYNFIKYKKIGKDLNYVCNDLFPKEINPNIIAYKTDLYNIGFFDIIKGENLGSFGIKKNNILSFKKIKKYYISDGNNDNDKIYYFIFAGKSGYILSN